jgi:hypothetical protein
MQSGYARKDSSRKQAAGESLVTAPLQDDASDQFRNENLAADEPTALRFHLRKAAFGECCVRNPLKFWNSKTGPARSLLSPARHLQPDGRNIMPLYVVRHLGEEREELPCFLQLEDEGAAMYFNIVHGRKVRRRFTTERVGDKCTDYVLVARESGTGGLVREREISLFNLTPHEVRLM